MSADDDDIDRPGTKEHAAPAPAAWDDDDERGHLDGPGPVFPGDTGQLTHDVRALLVTLLKRRYVSAEANPNEWRLLRDNEPAVRMRMHDLFLDLVVNREYEVAFKRQATSETGDRFPTLLHDQAYSREETVALVLLRRELRRRQQAGSDTAYIDKADLLDEIAAHRPESATDRSRDNRAALNAVDNLAKMDLLLRTAQPDRYRIPTVLEVLLPVTRLVELLDWLATQNGRGTPTTGPAAPDAPAPGQDSMFDGPEDQPGPAPDTRDDTTGHAPDPGHAA